MKELRCARRYADKALLQCIYCSYVVVFVASKARCSKTVFCHAISFRLRAWSYQMLLLSDGSLCHGDEVDDLPWWRRRKLLTLCGMLYLGTLCRSHSQGTGRRSLVLYSVTRAWSLSGKLPGDVPQCCQEHDTVSKTVKGR